MAESITWVGLDAHKKSIAVAMLLPNQKDPIQWEVANTEPEIRRLARKLIRSAPGEVRCCYEAGPTGYGLKRLLETDDIVCEVVAPSLIPIKAGDRIKTDRRDAQKLAGLLRAGLLTEVRAPTPEEESIRDLTRCREDAKEDQTRARHRLGKFLLRRSVMYTLGKPWTTTHRRWLGTLKFDDASVVVFADYIQALDLVGERLKGLDAQIEAFSKREPYAGPVSWLRCFHGIDTTTAMAVVAELHDIARFKSARALMAYVGLVPSEHSSGGREVRGAITKAGNTHVRRLFVETSHHVRHSPKVGPKLSRRRAGAPPEAIAIATRAQLRLHRRYWALVKAGKTPNKARTAVARELAGFIWACLQACRTAARPDATPPQRPAALRSRGGSAQKGASPARATARTGRRAQNG